MIGKCSPTAVLLVEVRNQASNVFFFRLIQSEPNTYSYTKAITEDLVAEYGSKFPLAIARPSIGKRLFHFYLKKHITEKT